jgi:hypothetical protein
MDLLSSGSGTGWLAAGLRRRHEHLNYPALTGLLGRQPVGQVCRHRPRQGQDPGDPDGPVLVKRMPGVVLDQEDIDSIDSQSVGHRNSWGIEHAIAEPKQWRPLQRCLGRREHFQETALAIAGLASDRAAVR